jgi:hypothetical protein
MSPGDSTAKSQECAAGDLDGRNQKDSLKAFDTFIETYGVNTRRRSNA